MTVVSAVVRKVRASDRQDVLDISSKIWGGHDYLPSVIDEWPKNPKCHTYGVEVDRRLAAIGNLRLVDRNATGWMEGLRVHPTTGKGATQKCLHRVFLTWAEPSMCGNFDTQPVNTIESRSNLPGKQGSSECSR